MPYIGANRSKLRHLGSYTEMIKVLFICHGNICRSPAALYLFRDKIRREGLEACFQASSAATSAEELGNPVYPPMRRELGRRGIDCSGHRARRITEADYDNFDYLVIMDERNRRNMLRFYGGDPEGKIRTLLSFTAEDGEIPDPWYTGDFEGVCDAIETGLRGLIDTLLPS